MESPIINDTKRAGIVLVLLLLSWACGQEKLDQAIQETQRHFQKMVFENPLSLLLPLVCMLFILWGCGRFLRWVVQKTFVKGPLERQDRWGLKEIALAIVMYILIQPLIFGIFSLLFEIPDLENHQFKLSLYWVINGTFCTMLGLALVFMRGSDVRELGFRMISPREVAGCLLGYLTFLPFYFSAIVLAQIVFVFLGIDPVPQKVAQDILASQGFTWWFGVVTTVVAAALMEEFIFRIFIYQGLRKRTDRYQAAIFSSLLFALVHQNMLAFFPIFCLGLFLCLLYEKTRTLWAPALAHAFHNGLTLTYLVFFLK